MAKKSKYITLKLTQDQAEALGIVWCVCGHRPNNHFSFDARPCAHCECKKYRQEIFLPPKKSPPTEPYDQGQRGCILLPFMFCRRRSNAGLQIHTFIFPSGPSIPPRKQYWSKKTKTTLTTTFQRKSPLERRFSSWVYTHTQTTTATTRKQFSFLLRKQLVGSNQPIGKNVSNRCCRWRKIRDFHHDRVF